MCIPFIVACRRRVHSIHFNFSRDTENRMTEKLKKIAFGHLEETATKRKNQKKMKKKNSSRSCDEEIIQKRKQMSADMTGRDSNNNNSNLFF